MSSDKFLRGAMILTLAGLMVKVIGSVNRILLSRLLGGEGIGLYQMAYPVYLCCLRFLRPAFRWQYRLLSQAFWRRRTMLMCVRCFAFRCA